MKRNYTMQLTQEEMIEYGEFFKSMRMSIGLSLGQMAEQIGVFRTTWDRWEKALTVPNIDIDVLESKVREVVKAHNT